MSISENTRSVLSKEVTIRYIAPSSRNNSATGKSNDSSTVRSFTTSTCSNPTGIAESSHFITLEDNKEDEADGDAFDSAKEVDEEEENEQNDEQHVNSKLDFDSNSTLKCGQNDDDDLDEKVAMECKVVKQDEYKATADDAPLPLLDTATFSTDQAPDKLISKANLKYILARFQKLRHRHHSLPFLRFRLIFAAFIFAAIFMLPSFLTGFITGLYISFLVFLFLCVSDPMAKNHHSSDQQMCCKKVLNQIALKSAQQEKSGKIYKGWMNILNEHYHPHTFHVNTIQTVLVRLDGNLLRICRPELKMLKHAFHVDPTLTETEPRMVAQSIYDLTGATVKLRPQRLARRRWFSRKYPICIKLAKFDDGAGTEVGPGAPMTTRLRRPLLKKQSDTDSTATSTLPEEAEAAAGEEQQKFAPERKTIARMQMQQSNSSESDELSELSDAELPLRHSLSDFTFGSNGHPAKRQPKKRRQSGRYIFLFGRSAREKERWFHKLRQASSKYTADVSLPNYESNSPRRRVSFDSLGNIADRMSKDFLLYSLQQFQFTKQMALLLDQMSEKFTESECGVVAMDLGLNKWTRPSNVVSDHFVLLVNLLATRGFYDFCRDKYWCEAVRNKIQTKLATIHLPYFIETLELSTFDLGTSVPKIVKVYQPKVDEWGIWCDFEIKYHGLIKLGLETRVNLMKLKSVSEFMADDTTNPSSSNGDDKAGQLPFCSSAFRTSPSRYSDEEMPESPETSPDEEFGAKLKEFTSKRQKTGQKILSLVDRFTHSKYFRDAVELRPVRKMMEEISSTRLMLNVEVTELEGTMTANLAAPPSDRLWYAFRTPPQMSIKAIPQVGERSVVYSALSEWIENKLQLILEKNLVLPNMDDVVIPIMSGNQLLQGNLNR